MQNNTLKWVYLVALSIIWGSSFILIKKGLIGLDPVQLGSIRIIFATFFLLIIGWKSLKTIEKSSWKWIAISGILGTGIPVYLFAYAETEIDSAIAAILNSGVPLLTLILGLVAFGTRFIKKQLLGILLGLAGAIALILIGSQVNPDQNYWYTIYVIVATLLYAINVNIIKRHMQNINAMAIATGNFIFIVIPAIILLAKTDFFTAKVLENPETQTSLIYILILAILGTATAKVMFNRLVQISNPIFASSVTYTMPIISVMWGVLDNEKFTIPQLAASLIIISGVCLANIKSKPKNN